MSNEMKRYLIPLEESLPPSEAEVKSIQMGISKGMEISKESEESKNITILIPTKENIMGTTFEGAVGTNRVRELAKNRPIKLSSGGTMKVESERTFKNRWTKDIIIGVYAERRMLNLIDDAKNAAAVIVVPGITSDDSLKEWIKTWNPEIIGEPSTAPQELIDNPVVVEALKALSWRVNKKSSMLTDKEACFQLLFKVYKSGELIDPDSIRAWTIRDGWSSKAADGLKKVAQDIISGKRVKITKQALWDQNIIENLREDAKKSSD